MAPNGRLYLGGQSRAFDSEGVIRFLEYLCRRYRKKDLIVVWDGATIHRSQAVKDFLAKKKGRVHLVALPGYSPERSAAAAEPGGTTVEPIEAGAEKSIVPKFERFGGGSSV